MSRNSGIGKVYTTRIQKPHFSGLGVYNPEKVFFKEDENGKVYIDNKLCSITKTPQEGIKSVVIAGKTYTVIENNGLYWTTENLVYDTEHSVTNPDHPEFGNYYPIDDLDSIPFILEDGWRIANVSDFDILADNNDTHALQSTGYSVWPDATNETGFSAVPNRIPTSTTFDRGILWTSNYNVTRSEAKTFIIRNDSCETYDYGTTTISVCVRLCKTKNHVNLFDEVKSQSYLIPAYCGTSGQTFIIEVNNSTQRTLVIPATEKMKNKRLRISWDNGDDVANRYIGGQVDTIPTTDRTEYPIANMLYVANFRKVFQRSYVDVNVGDYNYLLLFFDSGLADTSKFIDSLQISDDGWYY